MNLLERTLARWGYARVADTSPLPGEPVAGSTEVGARTTPNEMLELMYLRMEPSFMQRQVIADIRDMDQRDPRVKKIHERTARAACKGLLRLEIAPGNATITRLWQDYQRRCELDNPQKLESDMRGQMMEGNLPMQWVADLERGAVIRGIRMPTETIKPLVGLNGQFENAAAAYEQWDWVHSKRITTFPLWQLNMARVRPDNWDHWGSLGRPYLDATRTVWKQLVMTEKDLAVRRHMRAPMRVGHFLEGATAAELAAYENKVLNKQGQVTTDYFSNKKGSVTAVQGDAHLDEIADVVHLLETFFTGAPAPKGLFGYAGDLSRDILEDLKRDYYEELDALQDSSAWLYQQGFRLHLLLNGINPDAERYEVLYAQRRTETRNQQADLALKYQALGVPAQIVHREAGLDPQEIREYHQANQRNSDPYPSPLQIAGGGGAPAPGAPKVSVTPGNARKGDSGTAVSNA